MKLIITLVLLALVGCSKEKNIRTAYCLTGMGAVSGEVVAENSTRLTLSVQGNTLEVPSVHCILVHNEVK